MGEESLVRVELIHTVSTGEERIDIRKCYGRNILQQCRSEIYTVPYERRENMAD